MTTRNSSSWMEDFNKRITDTNRHVLEKMLHQRVRELIELALRLKLIDNAGELSSQYGHAHFVHPSSVSRYRRGKTNSLLVAGMLLAALGSKMKWWVKS